MRYDGEEKGAQIRPDGAVYYGGNVWLREGDDGDAILEWATYEGGSVTLKFSTDELLTLATEAQKLHDEIIKTKPWLA